MSADVVLEMSGMSHRFGAVQALDSADLELRRGEVMALLGENGAGKSTLVKALGGLQRADHGEIRIDGEPVDLGTTRRSRDAGIAVATQELSVIDRLSVSENIFLGGVKYSGRWSTRKLAGEARGRLDAVGLDHVDPRVLAGDLSLAERQLVEIARLLARRARILILDEPTASLSDVEIELVMRSVKHLSGQGISVIYVTHRLGEVFEIADRVTIMRNGRSMPPQRTSDLTMDKVIEGIVGRPLEEMYPARPDSFGAVALTLDEFAAEGVADPVSIEVRRGEILGLAGQAGSGTGALLRAVAGVSTPIGGRVTVQGSLLPNAYRLANAIHRGIAYCSGDRKADGIFGALSVTVNLTAPALPRLTRHSWLPAAAEDDLARRLAERFAIDNSRLADRAGTLSGGNQQKTALAKWLGASPVVLLVEEPTRGVDVGARAEIYAHLRSLANDGLAVVFASSDLDEVHGLADSVCTFFRGRVVRCIPAGDVSKVELLHDITSGPSTTASHASTVEPR
jgi:ribose transport system ATP-binding protein